MNSAEMLWEVILAKWVFWQRVSKQLLMQKFRLLFQRGRLFFFLLEDLCLMSWWKYLLWDHWIYPHKDVL